MIGADGRIRTADLLITNQLLYQLSYIGLFANGCFSYMMPLSLSTSICTVFILTGLYSLTVYRIQGLRLLFSPRTPMTQSSCVRDRI